MRESYSGCCSNKDYVYELYYQQATSVPNLMSVASLSGILEGGAHVAPPRANEPIFDSVRIRVKRLHKMCATCH